MNIDQVKKMMDEEKITLVDIRDPQTYQQAHIQGALNINDDNLKEFLESTDKNIPLICYCYHGYSSQGAAEFFKESGFKAVYSMDGGFEAWRSVYPHACL